MNQTSSCIVSGYILEPIQVGHATEYEALEWYLKRQVCIPNMLRDTCKLETLMEFYGP